MEVIAVNSGNYSTKAKSKAKEIIFRTKTQENIDATKYLLINDIKYEVGEGEIDIDNLKHNSLTHTLCTLHAISVLHSEYDICLVVCLPINQFKNKQLREAYRDHLKGTYHLDTENGQNSFCIKEVIVYMEGAAALLAHTEIYRNRLVNVVDIGGYNVNAAQFDNLHLVHNTETDLDLGAYNIKSNIMQDLNKAFNFHLKEHELEYILNNPTQEQAKVINKHYVSFINRLRNELKRRGYNLSLNDFLFTGGGSFDLEKHIRNEFTKSCIGTVFDTVRGLYEVGVRKCSSV